MRLSAWQIYLDLVPASKDLCQALAESESTNETRDVMFHASEARFKSERRQFWFDRLISWKRVMKVPERNVPGTASHRKYAPDINHALASRS